MGDINAHGRTILVILYKKKVEHMSSHTLFRSVCPHVYENKLSDLINMATY
jgi:hypothetical protein